MSDTLRDEAAIRLLRRDLFEWAPDDGYEWAVRHRDALDGIIAENKRLRCLLNEADVYVIASNRSGRRDDLLRRIDAELEREADA